MGILLKDLKPPTNETSVYIYEVQSIFYNNFHIGPIVTFVMSLLMKLIPTLMR